MVLNDVVEELVKLVVGLDVIAVVVDDDVVVVGA